MDGILLKGFLFYPSFHDALEGLDDATYGKLTRALADYAFKNKEPKLTGLEKMFFDMAKPLIDKSKAKSNAGKTGGQNGAGVSRNKGNNNASKKVSNQYQNNNKTIAKQNQNESESISNQYQNNNKTIRDIDIDIDIDIDKDIEGDIDKDKTDISNNLFKNTELENIDIEKKKVIKEKKHKYGEFNNVLLTDKENTALAEKFKDDAILIIDNFSSLKEMKGYKYKSDYLAILNWGAKAFYEKKNEPTESNPIQYAHTETDEQGNTIAIWPDGFRARLGVGEYLNANGEREYNKQYPSVPRDAKPRPSRDYFFNRESKTWTTA